MNSITMPTFQKYVIVHTGWRGQRSKWYVASLGIGARYYVMAECGSEAAAEKLRYSLAAQELEDPCKSASTFSG